MALFAEIFAKFNHNHDARGRFASSAGTSPVLPAKTRLIPPIDRPQLPATRFFSRISLKPKKKPAKDSPAATMMKAFWETTHPNPLADDERLFGARIDGVDVWGSATLVDPLYSRGGGDDGTNNVVDVWWLRAITRGGGRVALTHITELADEHGVTLTLHAVPVTASPDGKGGKKLTQKKLNAFYKSFGFVEDTYAYSSETGSLTRGRGPNYFTREPRAVTKFNANHEPAGSSRGGQFAPRAGAGSAASDDRKLIPDNAALREAVVDGNSGWSLGWDSMSEWIHDIGSAEVDAADLRQACDDALDEMMPKLKTWKRITSDDFNSLIESEDPTFHNQYVTGDSRGMYNPVRRQLAEDVLFGYQVRAGDYNVTESSYGQPTLGVLTEEEALKRPVYGYLTDDADGSWNMRPMAGDDTDEYDAVSQYGDVAVRLKDRVRARTTFTVGDSLITSIKDGRSEWEGGDVLHVFDLPPLIEDDTVQEVQHAPLPLDASRKSRAMRMSPWADKGDFEMWAEHGATKEMAEKYVRSFMYIEAQYHGKHLTLDDIEEIVIRSPHSSPSRDRLINTLRRRGIPYREVQA